VLVLQRTDSHLSMFTEIDRVCCMKWTGGRFSPSFGVTDGGKIEGAFDPPIHDEVVLVLDRIRPVVWFGFSNLRALSFKY